MSTRPAQDLDAAMVLGMASTAIPFAHSRQAQAERWLRILRLHGEAGTALQALGVSEAPLEGPAVSDTPMSDPSAGDPVELVSETATARAGRRGAEAVGTVDVLIAVMEVYGNDFNHVLHVHGTDRDEVLARLERQAA